MARVGTLVLFLNLEETFNLSPLSMMSAIGLLYMEYILLQYFPSIPDLLRVSNMTWCWILSDDFFYIHWDDYIIFILYSVEVVHHIYWFLYVELSLHPRDKSHLTMVCDPFNVLLNSVCWYLVEDFCTYAHQGYWPVIFFSCSFLVWLWYSTWLP